MDEYLSAWMKAEHQDWRFSARSANGWSPGFKFNSPNQARLGRYNLATV
jgi:hypothetical protein